MNRLPHRRGSLRGCASRLRPACIGSLALGLLLAAPWSAGAEPAPSPGTGASPGVAPATGSPPAPDAPPAPTEGVRRSPHLQISLLTMSPSGELFTAYGHTAIRVRDLDSGRDLAYDYGSYNASAPDAPLRFIRGTLPYWVSVSPTEDVVSWYGLTFGGITEQVLAIEPLQAQLLARQLARNALPANRYYKYHHFRDNCATRPRDLLDGALGGALRRATFDADSGRTFRILIDRSMYWAPYLRWPTYGLLNGMIDVPVTRWEQMFLPAYLREELDQLKLVGADGTVRPAVSARRMLVGTEEPARRPDPSAWPGVLVCLGLAGLSSLPLAVRRRRPRLARGLLGGWLACWGFLAGAYGVLITVAWAISPYPETKANGNILLFHPLLLLLVPLGIALAFGWRPARRACQWLLLASTGALLVAPLLELTGMTPQHLLGFAVAAACVSVPAYCSLRALSLPVPASAAAVPAGQPAGQGVVA